MSPTEVGKIRGECLVSNSVHRRNHWTEYVEDTRRQYEYGAQAQLGDVQYNMNLSDNSQSQSRASANPRSRYLSSMDDGKYTFVNIYNYVSFIIIAPYAQKTILDRASGHILER